MKLSNKIVFKNLNREKNKISKSFHQYNKDFFIKNYGESNFTYKKEGYLSYKVRINQLSYKSTKYNIYFNHGISSSTYNFLSNNSSSSIDYLICKILKDNVVINTSTDLELMKKEVKKLNDLTSHMLDVSNEFHLKNINFFNEFHNLWKKQSDIYIKYRIEDEFNVPFDEIINFFKKQIFLDDKIPFIGHCSNIFHDGKHGSDKGYSYLHKTPIAFLSFNEDDTITISDSYLGYNEIFEHGSLIIKIKDWFNYSHKNNILHHLRFLKNNIINLSKESYILKSQYSYEDFKINEKLKKYQQSLSSYLDLFFKESFNDFLPETLAIELIEQSLTSEFKKECIIPLAPIITCKNTSEYDNHILNVKDFKKYSFSETIWAYIFDRYYKVTNETKMFYLNEKLNETISDVYFNGIFIIYFGNYYYNKEHKISIKFKNDYDEFERNNE